MGAWIETSLLSQIDVNKSSHPTWVRGLKQDAREYYIIVFMSHPTWVRGLKRDGKLPEKPKKLGRTLRGCVD